MYSKLRLELRKYGTVYRKSNLLIVNNIVSNEIIFPILKQLGIKLSFWIRLEDNKTVFLLGKKNSEDKTEIYHINTKLEL